MPRRASIEICRGVAATMVLTSHAAIILAAPADYGVSPFGDFFYFGRSGVDFFFVLSGFLISLVHWQDIGKPTTLRRYAVRRMTRIYPTYWLVLLLVVPFDVFGHTLFDDYGKPLEVLKSIFLLPQSRTILDVTWSLRNELLFYGLFGLAILNQRIGLITAAVWAACVAIRPLAVGAVSNEWTDVLTYPMNVEFIAGVVAGWAYPRMRTAHPGKILGFGLFAFVALCFFEDRSWLIHPDSLATRHMGWVQYFLVCSAYGLAASCIIVGLSILEDRHRVRLPAPLVTLGAASYVLYLIHVPGLLVLGASERVLHLSRFAPVWLIGLAYIVIIIAAALILHATVEKPVLRWLQQPRAPSAIKVDQPLTWPPPAD